MNIQHDHDEDGNCIEGTQPSWRFSMWDIIGVSTFAAGNVLGAIGAGLGLLAQEFCAAANYSRQEKDLREAQRAYEAQQRAIGQDIAAIVHGPHDE